MKGHRLPQTSEIELCMREEKGKSGGLRASTGCQLYHANNTTLRGIALNFHKTEDENSNYNTTGRT